MSRRRAVLALIGAGAVVLVWTVVAARRPTVLVPSPAETAVRLAELADGPLWSELGRTMWRGARGSTLAVIGGVALGLGAGSWPSFDALSRPLRAVLVGIPPIITVVLVSLWVGLDGDAAPWVVALATMPFVWLATAEAVKAIDPDVVEMAAGLHVSPWWRLSRLTLPAVAAPVAAAAASVVATSVRLTIMAELLSGSDGVGARIARARTTLDTPEVFAWAVVAIALALLLETAALRVGERPRRAWPGRQQLYSSSAPAG
ncbi:MAG: ABC transporter permease subunit [Actinomycetota bacterium]